MELTVLGCSGGYPEPGRPCSGYLVTTEATRVWLDAGAGTLAALLVHVDPWELDAIWISHLHPDHWTDLPMALHRMAVTAPAWDRPPPPVLGPPGWQELAGVAAQGYPSDRTPCRPVALADRARLTVGDLTLHTRAVSHGIEAFAVRVEGPAGTIAYSGDTARCPALVDLARGADLFVCEATLAPGDTAPISMNAAEAGAVAAEADAGRLLLTHLLPGVDPDASLRAAREVFDGPVDLARPGDAVRIRSG